MESLYASKTARRVGGVLKSLLPYFITGVIGAVGWGFRWGASRASRDELTKEVGSLTADAKAIQGTAFHGDELAKNDAKQLASLWPHIVALEAELYVYRTYYRLAADPAKRGLYIDSAKAFYAKEFQTQLKDHADNPAEALRFAMQAQWSPPH